MPTWSFICLNIRGKVCRFEDRGVMKPAKLKNEEAKWQEILFRVHAQTGTYQSSNPEMIPLLKAVGKPSFLSPGKKAAVIEPLSRFQCYLQQPICFSSLSLLFLSWPGIFLSGLFPAGRPGWNCSKPLVKAAVAISIPEPKSYFTVW